MGYNTLLYCPTLMDNTLTRDQTVLVASTMNGYDINILWYINDDIHERASIYSTKILLSNLILKLSRDSKVQTMKFVDV